MQLLIGLGPKDVDENPKFVLPLSKEKLDPLELSDVEVVVVVTVVVVVSKTLALCDKMLDS